MASSFGVKYSTHDQAWSWTSKRSTEKGRKHSSGDYRNADATNSKAFTIKCLQAVERELQESITNLDTWSERINCPWQCPKRIGIYSIISECKLNEYLIYVIAGLINWFDSRPKSGPVYNGVKSGTSTKNSTQDTSRMNPLSRSPWHQNDRMTCWDCLLTRPGEPSHSSQRFPHVEEWTTRLTTTPLSLLPTK